jgi:hypothetical protein
MVMTDISTDITDITGTIDTHLAGYCEADPDKRTDLLGAAWADDGELMDPPLEGRGVAEIGALVDAVLAHYPDHRFERTSAVDVHHGFARYEWKLVSPGGDTAVAGTDFAQLDDDGKLARVIGFFGALEPVG